MSSPTTSAAPQGMPHPDHEDPLTILLAHADDNMILSQRLGELISHAPELEIDIAIGNIALDHLGVARALFTHAGEVEGKGRDEDDFAMFRTEREFTNLLLVEQPNGDFANTIVRQFLVDTYQQRLWEELASSTDSTLAGIAERALKEAHYHHRFSAGWLVRLGDGTDESHRRSQDAIDSLWRYTEEMFSAPASGYRSSWKSGVDAVLSRAGLECPSDEYQATGGRAGFHTEHLGPLLAEMQWMQRSYPEARW